MPAVTGMPADRAEDRLGAEGFGGVRVSVANGDYPPGYVVAQSPCAGCLAAGGSGVTLQVGTGKAATPVPSVLGLAPADARQALEAAGFGMQARVQQEPPGPDSEQRLDKIWEAVASGGCDAAPDGSTVTVWVNPATAPSTTTSTGPTGSSPPP